MSDPAIYIALLGKTIHVPPRYTRSDSHLSGPILLWISWCGIPDLPYAIRKFGIRSLESGDWEIMVRLSGPTPPHRFFRFWRIQTPFPYAHSLQPFRRTGDPFPLQQSLSCIRHHIRHIQVSRFSIPSNQAIKQPSDQAIKRSSDS